MARIVVDTQDRIATVSLNRPERLNAVDLAGWRELKDAVDGVAARDDVGCVVFRGVGDRAFCAGHDLSRFDDERNSPDQVRAFSAAVKAAMDAIRDCPHPTLAMVRGPCMGAGVQLATNCDLRIASDTSRISLTPKKVGLFLEYELMDALISLTGRATAMEMVLEGRTYGAEEAVAKRLVDRATADADLERETYALAATLAETGKADGLIAAGRRDDL